MPEFSFPRSLLHTRKPAWLTGGISLLIFTLLVRLYVLWGAAGDADFGPSHGDMKFYHDWALRIAHGQWTDHRAFYGLPLYAYWLAAVYALVGNQPYLAVLGQILAEAGTVAFIYQTGCRLGTGKTERSGWIIGTLAAVGWIFFQPAQTYAVVLMPTSYFVLTFWFVVWWIVREAQDRRSQLRLRDFAWLGLLLGVVAMMVANILFLLPLLLVVLVVKRPSPATTAVSSSTFIWKKKLAAVALLGFGVVLGAAPCWLHNYVIAGEPVFLSAHGGLNFFLGNNRAANGYPRVPSGLRADQQGLLADSITLAEAAAGHPLRRVEVSAYWSAQAREFIHQQPLAWLRLMATKLRNFWSAFQYDDLSVISGLRENGITTPGLRFGLVAALALPGLVFALLRPSAARWIAAAVLLHMTSLLTVFITERYRLASVPGLLLLAAYGLTECWRAARTRDLRQCAAYATLLLAAATFVYWPQADPSLRLLDDYNTGVADFDAGESELAAGQAATAQSKFARAQTKLERVLAASPNNVEANFALGNLWLARGDRPRAKQCYRRTLELDPLHSRVLNNLGVLALEENRPELAAQFLVSALNARPGDAKTLFLLARARMQSGDFPAARVALSQALVLEPNRADFLALRDRLAEARAGLP